MGRGNYSGGVTPSMDVGLAIGAGKFPGVSAFTIQGTRDDLSQTDGLLWDFAESIAWPDNAGEAMSVTSTGLDDGVQLRVQGLDENFDSKEELVIISGTTPLAGLWTRLNFMVVIGTQACVGTLTVSSATTTFCSIDPTRQLSVNSQYSMARNKMHQIPQAIGTLIKDGGNSNASALFRINVRERPDGVFKRRFGFGLPIAGSTVIELADAFPGGIVGPADLYISTVASANNIAAAMRLQILIQDT